MIIGDTIYALASAPGRAGVAVVRLSGPQAWVVLQALTGAPVPATRAVQPRTLTDPATGEVIDRALILWFPNPHSFTGEDVTELQVHGGRAVLDRLFTVLGQQTGCRLAQPGEFTRRAFENGKLDLTGAEAIVDLVDAETEQQRRQALRQLEGELGTLYRVWAEELTGTLARLEAYLDFPDEALPPELAAAHEATVHRIGAEISRHLAQGTRGERLRDGIRIAILGAPNAGKSSLLNALTAREAAIVSPTPGTTRDVIEASLNLFGFPVVLQDTAGLHDSDDAIEAEGVRRAEAKGREADLKLLVFDRSQPFPIDLLGLIDERTWLVANKADLSSVALPAQLAQRQIITIEAQRGIQRLEALTQALQNYLVADFGITGAPSLTRARHREALEEALMALGRVPTAPGFGTSRRGFAIGGTGHWPDYGHGGCRRYSRSYLPRLLYREIIVMRIGTL